jgi:hypothetical protein
MNTDTNFCRQAGDRIAPHSAAHGSKQSPGFVAELPQDHAAWDFPASFITKTRKLKSPQR